MPDPIVPDPAPAAPVVTQASPAVPSPAPAEPVVAAVQPAEPAPASAPDVKVVEPVPAAKPDEPKLEPSLLEKADKAAAEKAAAEAAAKPPEPDKAKPGADPVKPAEPPVQPVEPVKYEFKLPETLRPDEKRIGAFTTLLDEARGSGDFQVFGQKALEMHAEAMSAYAEQVGRNQIDAWNKVTRNWQTRSLADEEFGGSGHDTAIQAIARARDKLISSARPGTEKYKADLAEFNELDTMTKVGSHPALLRLLHNAARLIDEPQAHHLPVDLKPPKGNGRPPKGGIYTHPSSQNMEK